MPLSLVSTESTPAAQVAALPPARDALRQAIEKLSAAQAPLQALADRMSRLRSLIAAHQSAEAELAGLRAEDERMLGEWLAAGWIGDRPAPSPETIEAERRVQELAADAAAASALLPAINSDYQEASGHVAAAGEHRDASIIAAAGEAAQAIIRAELVPAITAVLRIESRLRGLAAALRERATGSAPLPGSADAAARLVDAIAAARSEPAVVRADDAGHRFLDRLAADPEAVL